MIQEALPHLPSNNGQVQKTEPGYSPEIESAEESPKSSTLIEFPGGRNVPEWRKQLSQRVREVQERKAREAAEELAAAQEAGLVSCAMPSGQLELVPDLENPAFNPIVTKALERIERARRPDYQTSQRTATAAAPAMARETELRAEAEKVDPPVTEAKPKLTMVPPVVEPVQEVVTPVELVINELIVDSAAPVVEAVADESVLVESIAPEPEIQTAAVAEALPALGNERKPIRVISDNDIALSYLETCLSLPALDADTRSDIPGITRRFFSGVLDLLFIALMVSPAAAAIHFSGGVWAEPRIIGLMAGITAVTMFAYLTICTAMTGRTLAMRIFRMRTIDLRTGMIPTGGQSITRAIAYVFSFALLGLGLAYALIDPDKRAVHDRVSKTIVIRA